MFYNILNNSGEKLHAQNKRQLICHAKFIKQNQQTESLRKFIFLDVNYTHIEMLINVFEFDLAL